MIINFNNIPENTVRESKAVKPGVGVFVIASMEAKTSSKGTPYINTVFQTEDGTKKFYANFWLNNDKGLSRLKELAKNSAVELGEVDIETLISRFIGKKVGLIVDGEEKMKNINGNDVKVVEQVLRFAKFSFPFEQYDDFKNTPVTTKPLAIPVEVADGFENNMVMPGDAVVNDPF